MLKKKSEKASFASLISKAPGAVLIFFIKSYQVFISPLFGQKCKHYPSCSNYSRQAIHKHGVAKGFILTTARLIRCNPWSLGGFDPVPEDISFKQPESFKLSGNYQTQLYKMDES